MANKKFTKEEMAKLTENFAYGATNPLGNHASGWASDYDYDSDGFDAEEAVRDAVVEGVRWALRHLKK